VSRVSIYTTCCSMNTGHSAIRLQFDTCQRMQEEDVNELDGTVEREGERERKRVRCGAYRVNSSETICVMIFRR
jgi:hypothetical protein